jgi:trehalose 6-phosphate synthase
MTVTARLVGAIWLSALAVIAGFGFLQIREERQRLTIELDHRAVLLGEGLKEVVEPTLARGGPALERVLKKFEDPRQVVVVYDRFGNSVAGVPASVLGRPSVRAVAAAIASAEAQKDIETIEGRKVYVYVTPLTRDDKPAGALGVFLDASYLESAEWALWRYNALRFLVLAVVVSGIAFLVVRASVTHPMAQMAEWAKTLRAGHLTPPPPLPDGGLFGPLAQQVSVMASSLSRARAAAEYEAVLRVQGETIWTEERLKQFVNLKLGEPLFVVSNREPVSHVRRGRQIVAQTPASGLVTAMEPVLRACGGVWVAHGSGEADREVVDAAGRVGVPPDDPRYTLRRVWLSKEEEEGYYYGFANEGLWPLCHIVHTRPLFRPEDWAHYRAVNQKFADAVLDEMAGTDGPMVLIQDYHFALLPTLVKQARPDARVAIFWHIPWPNFEAFGICPWQDDLLLGMLGADLIGFHTQYHCNNFLETVERVLEARIDWEHFSVSRGEHVTYVKPLPISVVPGVVDDPPQVSRAEVLKELGISAEFVGVGVERVDYTKGLPERFRALGRFFERHPEYRERVVFVQLAAPSRTQIKRYQDLQAEVEETVQEVNGRFQTRGWRPILYLARHHDHREIWPLYRHADFCMVTSLHDGMNLVAKEFVAAREDGDGVLILSRFTGAARELRDALLVNPYDLDQMAEAIRTAVVMPAEERTARMARMRRVVFEHNIYRWAGLLLGELSRIPEEAVGPKV